MCTACERRPQWTAVPVDADGKSGEWCLIDDSPQHLLLMTEAGSYYFAPEVNAKWTADKLNGVAS